MIEPTQPGKPYHYSNINDIPLPPPPPPAEYYMQQKTGKLWKFSIPILMLLFFGIIAVLAYPVVMSVVKPSKDVTPTPYVPFSLGATTSQSTAASDTSYRNDMNSLNYYRLIPAWSKALSHRDWNTISYHTDKQDFVILCVADYPCNGSDWPTTKGALEGGYLQLSIPEPYKLVTNICPDLTNWGPRM